MCGSPKVFKRSNYTDASVIHVGDVLSVVSALRDLHTVVAGFSYEHGWIISALMLLKFWHLRPSFLCLALGSTHGEV